MNTKRYNRDRFLVEKFTNQPSILPETIRHRVEKAWGTQEPIQLYAMADLDRSLNLTETWVCLSPNRVAIVKTRTGGNGDIQFSDFAREDLKHIREVHSLSFTSVIFEGDDEHPHLGMVRFTHRQRHAIGAISFVLSQQVAGKPIRPPELNADAHYANAMSEAIRAAQASYSENNQAVFWRILGYLKPYKATVVLGLSAAILFTALMMIPPRLTGMLIDDVINPIQKGEGVWANAWKLGWIILAGFAATLVLRQFFIWIRFRWMSIMAEYVASDLRRDVYDHLHKLSVHYFSGKQTGSLISRVSSDSDRVWDFLAFGVTEMTTSALMLLFLTAMMLTLDWQLGLVVLIPIPVIFGLIYWNGKAMHGAFLRIWRKWSDMTAVLSDTIPGVRVVKAFNQEEHEIDRFNQASSDVVTEAKRVHLIWTTFWPAFSFCVHLMQLIIIAMAIPRLIGSAPGVEPTLTIGTFVAFMGYLNMFFFPLETFAQISRMMNRSLSSAYRIFEVLDTEPDVFDQPNATRLEPVRGNIEFRDVIFGYDPVRQIIKGVSFKVEAGEMIGLVGPSGAGKTTIINLIARFYDAESGEVLIDGHNIRDLETGNYRSQIGMVMQDPYLFHGTILENIRYGHHSAGADDVIRAAKAANAHDFICKLPQGYDTICGERGHTLSGGERQRVSIARAVLHNPRILILDEATSSVDTETERNIQEAIDRLTSNRTVIAIAHRLSTLRKANRLLVTKDGHLVEEGPHEELLEKPDGLYRKLYEMQKELHEAYAI